VKITIKDSFAHSLLSFYLYNAFFVFCSDKHELLSEMSESEILQQRIDFRRLFIKLSLKGEVSFLNQLFYKYPIIVQLNDNEPFWFQYILNFPVEEYQKRVDVFFNDPTFNKIKTIYKREQPSILSLFPNIQSAEYVRKKFLSDEKIGNLPQELGWK
jgi:hypothetical protein